MSITFPKRHRIRRHRLEGEHEDFCVRFPSDDLAAINALAERRGVAMAELVRRAVKLFLATNMHMDHVHDAENGHD